MAGQDQHRQCRFDFAFPSRSGLLRRISVTNQDQEFAALVVACRRHHRRHELPTTSTSRNHGCSTFVHSSQARFERLPLPPQPRPSSQRRCREQGTLPKTLVQLSPSSRQRGWTLALVCTRLTMTRWSSDSLATYFLYPSVSLFWCWIAVMKGCVTVTMISFIGWWSRMKMLMVLRMGVESQVYGWWFLERLDVCLYLCMWKWVNICCESVKVVDEWWLKVMFQVQATGGGVTWFRQRWMNEGREMTVVIKLC